MLIGLLERLERREQLVGESGDTMVGASDAGVALDEDVGAVRGVLLRTPPFKFTISRMPIAVAEAAGEFCCVRASLSRRARASRRSAGAR